MEYLPQVTSYLKQLDKLSPEKQDQFALDVPATNEIRNLALIHAYGTVFMRRQHSHELKVPADLIARFKATISVHLADPDQRFNLNEALKYLMWHPFGRETHLAQELIPHYFSECPPYVLTCKPTAAGPHSRHPFFYIAELSLDMFSTHKEPRERIRSIPIHVVKARGAEVLLALDHVALTEHHMRVTYHVHQSKEERIKMRKRTNLLHKRVKEELMLMASE